MHASAIHKGLDCAVIMDQDNVDADYDEESFFINWGEYYRELEKNLLACYLQMRAHGIKMFSTSLHDCPLGDCSSRSPDARLETQEHDLGDKNGLSLVRICHETGQNWRMRLLLGPNASK